MPSRSTKIITRWLCAVSAVALGLGLGLSAPGVAAAHGRDHGADPGHGRDHGRHSCRNAPDSVALPAGLRPQGITSGPGSTYYVGSLADGRIATGDLCRGTSRVLLAGATGRQLRGLAYDQRSGLVWAVGNVGTVAHVWSVSARSGTVVSDTVVPGGKFLNDLVVTRSAVYATDSLVDRLTTISLDRHGRASQKTPGFVALTGAWPAGNGTANNANGIRQLADGSLILNNSRVGGLWQVSAKSGATTTITVTGGPGLVGGDGLELVGRYVFDVRGSANTEVSVLKLRYDKLVWSATWVKALTDPTLDVPSTATYAAGSLWAVNARFGVASPETASYSITRLSFRC